ncbi:MAG: Pyruvate formate lyase-activating enzyme 1 [Promethearchaeota archaeon]|nr:MAG: Pyruvate formate lyase-activating enzyme 1 [Candidatus Lokiarchaeota archaeon]
MGKCKFCGLENKIISETLKICRNCILTEEWDRVKDHIMAVHKLVREEIDLPFITPECSESELVVQCNLCINECKLSAQDISYCGLRNPQKDQNGNLPFPNKTEAYLHGYLDGNPTNCCNAWFCPAGTERGFPHYSNYHGPEYGTHSYAAFLYGCSFDCLFCQNASHKIISKRNMVNIEDIANQIAQDDTITCICYFGGTPECQLPSTIHLSKLILSKIKNQPNRKFRICWEWNGTGNRELVEKCMEIALKTGGNIKFDLKNFHEKLNYALCGVSNKQTLTNFKFLAEKYFGTRGEGMPEISGCTLMVPGYTNEEEVNLIAKFIAEINPLIPYSLLVFHGAYKMRDLGITPQKQARRSLEIAKKYLKEVHLGNAFLLR